MHFPQDWNIPNAIRLRLGANTTGRQRALVADGYLMLVLHEVPRHGQRERRGAYFFRSPDGQWSSSRESSGIPNRNCLPLWVDQGDGGVVGSTKD